MTTKIYNEDGWYARVEVLEDNSDDKWRRFKLKVLETLRESPIFNKPPDGEIFDVDQRKDVAFGGMWHLRDDDGSWG